MLRNVRLDVKARSKWDNKTACPIEVRKQKRDRYISKSIQQEGTKPSTCELLKDIRIDSKHWGSWWERPTWSTWQVPG